MLLFVAGGTSGNGDADPLLVFVCVTPQGKGQGKLRLKLMYSPFEALTQQDVMTTRMVRRYGSTRVRQEAWVAGGPCAAWQ